MKLKDCINLKENKKNKQISFDIKKKVLKSNNLKIRDIMNLDVPISKKLQRFEDI